jgi:Ribbon-helix-helix protein, copG family
MPQFDREPDIRDMVITFRLTKPEAEWITATAKRLGLRGRADLIRIALDYWQMNAPEAKKLKKG